MSDTVRLIKIKEDIRGDNVKQAEKLRQEMQARGCYLVNLMSSPGAGKTSLLMQTTAILKDLLTIAVIEADIDSTVDAEQIAASGIEAVQLQTGGFCHLDATMVGQGLANLKNDELDLVFIENIGNLVCPAEFDTGASLNVMILSVPEGDDKPLKYPLMFSTCDVLLVNKIDYLATSLTDFNLMLMEKRVRKLNGAIKIFPLSARTGEGMEQWTAWLHAMVKKQKS